MEVSQQTAMEQILPIANLDSSKAVDSRATIKAVVTLIWPYSSSNAKLALLCSEPDFRLRRNKGQVRVQFEKSAAKAVATSRVGIGDTVHLSLEGARWTQDDHATKTPGKSVDGELLYNRQLRLRVWRDDESLAELDVDAPQSPVAQDTPQQQQHHPSPIPPERMLDRPDLDHWSSPAFLKDTSPSDFEIFSSGFNPFDEEDDLGLGGPRKRPKFGRVSGEWKYVSGDSPVRNANGSLAQTHSPSPSLTLDDGKDIATEDARMKRALGTPKPASRMAPPALPAVRTDGPPQSIIPDSQEITSQPVTPGSPRLTPVKSPALPLVSPFPGQAGSGAAPAFWGVESFKSNSTLNVDQDTQPQSPTDLVASMKDSGIMNFGLDGSSFSKPQSQPEDRLLENQAQEDLSSAGDAAYDAEQQQKQDTEGDVSPPLHLTDIVDMNMTVEGDEINSSSPIQRIVKPDEIFSNGEAGGSDRKSLLCDEKDTRVTLSSQVPSPVRKPAARENRLISDSARAFETSSPSPTFPASQDFRKSIQSQVESSLFGFPPPKPAVPDTQTQASIVTNSFETQHEIDIVQDLGEDVKRTETQERPAPLARYETQFDITPEMSQEGPRQRSFSTSFHRVDHILDRGLPMTPAATQSNLEEFALALDQKTLPPGPEHLRTRKDKAPSASKVKPRYSEVPEVISPWFRSRHTSRLQAKQLEKEDHLKEHDAAEKHGHGQVVNGFEKALQNGESAHDKVKDIPKTVSEEALEISGEDVEPEPAPNGHYGLTSDGFRTPLSYYAPLSALDTYLTASSTEGPMEIDVFGVVTSPSSQPARAKSGPKDYHIITHIADLSSYPNTIQVQCFRPFSKALPALEIGDVLILRNFVVKSTKRQYFLLSTNPSAWLAWRFSKGNNTEAGKLQKPAWVQQASKCGREIHSLEECPGPPVEVGPEERDHAFALRSWWEAQSQKPLNKQGL